MSCVPLFHVPCVPCVEKSYWHPLWYYIQFPYYSTFISIQVSGKNLIFRMGNIPLSRRCRCCNSHQIGSFYLPIKNLASGSVVTNLQEHLEAFIIFLENNKALKNSWFFIYLKTLQVWNLNIVFLFIAGWHNK